MELRKFIATTIKEYLNENYSNDIWYHGSNNKFNMFDLVNNKTYMEIDLPVWFFTKDLDYAKTYGKYIYKVKLNIHNTTSRPFSMETIYDMEGSNKKIAEIVKKYSRLKFGRKKIFVDQEIEGRLGITT